MPSDCTRSLLRFEFSLSFLLPKLRSDYSTPKYETSKVVKVLDRKIGTARWYVFRARTDEGVQRRIRGLKKHPLERAGMDGRPTTTRAAAEQMNSRGNLPSSPREEAARTSP